MEDNDEVTTLNKAIADAAAEQDEAKKEEPSKLEASNEEKEEEAKLDKRTTQALELLEALEDPKRARQVVQHLAKQAGLLNDPPQTKQEIKQAQRTIKEIVKEKLGENGAWLSDSLGDAIEEVFKEQTTQFENKLVEVENRREAEKFEKDYKQAVTELKITEEEAVEISKLADEMPWSGKSPLDKYLARMVKLVRNEATEKARAMETRQKQQANLRSQTKTLGVESNENRISKGSAKISIREAVLAAARGESLE